MIAPRRNGLIVTAASIAMTLWSALAWADTYPSRQIKLVVPFAAGGATDVAARLLADGLRERLGNVIVENRPGAGAVIGIEAVAGAEPDGYTLLFGSDSLLIQPLLNKNVTFGLKDFVPIARVRVSPIYFAVNPQVPARTVGELIALAKSKPGVLHYGSGGSGTILHLAGELLKLKTGVDIGHVPYKGEGPAANDVMAGHIEMIVGGTATLSSLSAEGKVRVLAMTGERRSPAMPDVPTMIESGYPGVVVVNWNGVFVPAKTPADIVAKLTEVVSNVVLSKEFLERGKPFEVSPEGLLTGADFRTFLEKGIANYREVIESKTFRLE